MIDYRNKVLGQIINTRRMTIDTPPDYIAHLALELTNNWSRQKRFNLREISELAGRLGFVSDTAPWLRFLMSQVYTSIAAAIGYNRAHLYTTQGSFRDMVKMSRRGGNARYDNLTLRFDSTAREITFAQSGIGKAIHGAKRTFYLNGTLC